MTDLEQQLADALTRGADDAPTAVGLADAARGRARRKRRARIVGVAAAAALCIAVPTAVVAVGHDSSGPGPSRVATDSSTDRVPAGMRLESWHSVSVLVPDSWGWGTLASWCADGGALTPRVQRPEEVAPAIRCSPESTYGISFQAIDNNGDFEWPVVTQDPKAGWPPGAYVGGRGIGGVLVMVTAPSQAEGLEVLATMRAIGPEGDLNGCSARRDRAPTVDVPDGAMAVCRYDADGQLEQSELLTGPDAKAAGAALDAAPQGQLDCQPSAAPPELIVMRDRERAATIELDGACTAIGGLAEGRIITPDVLYWALSPGWSGDATGLPLPPELRTR